MSGPQPSISVIIPTFNSLSTLAATLDSVRKQTAPPCEIIVVDDGSTDGTPDFLRRFSDLQLLVQPNRGVSVARNAGAAAARGEYLAFLDSDDLWHPQKLELQLRTAQELHGNFGVLGCGRTVFTPDEPPPSDNLSFSALPVLPLKRFDVYDLMLHWRFTTSAAFLTRSVFLASGGFAPDMRSGQDGDLWLRLAYHYPVYTLKLPLLYYLHRPGSLSNVKTEAWHANSMRHIRRWDPRAPGTLDTEKKIDYDRYRQTYRRFLYRHGKEMLNVLDAPTFLKHRDEFRDAFGSAAEAVMLFLICRHGAKSLAQSLGIRRRMT